MKHRHLFALPSALILGALVCSVPLVKAQDVAPAVLTEASAADTGERITSLPTFNFKFAGGTLGELAQALPRQIRDEAMVNLIVDEAVQSTRMPVFEFRNTTPESMLSALIKMMEGKGLVVNWAMPGTGGGSPFLVVRGDKPPSAPIDFKVESHAIAPLVKPTGPYEVAEVVGALRAFWEMDPTKKAEDLVVQYHEPSELLLIRMPKDSGLNVEHVLQQLYQNAHSSK